MPHLDPLTIGIHGPRGGGKSIILGLLEAELAADDGYVVVRTNPWEYDDQLDFKGTLIAQVLQHSRTATERPLASRTRSRRS